MLVNIKKLFFVSFGLTLTLGSIFLFFTFSLVSAATIDVTATVPTTAVCGNSIVEAGEECDISAGITSCYNRVCNSDCSCPVCGDLVVESGETCESDSDCGVGAYCEGCMCHAIACFLGGTKISLADGTNLSIEKIKTGSLVFSFNESSKKNEPARVLQTFKHKVNQYLVINNELKVTANHPLYVNNQWLEAGEIKIGDWLLNQAGQSVMVSSIQKEVGDFFVYNLEVEKNHNYFAQNYLAHNKGECVPTGPVVCNWGLCINGIQVGVCGNNCSGSQMTRSCVSPRCGDSNIDAGEQCDDGNAISGDGCSASCQLEVGCGNGRFDAGEQCDDGNTNSGDCCSAVCQFELIISNVSVSVTNTSATVNWQTACQATTSVLDWGKTVDVNEGSASGLSGQNYTYTITGLNLNTVYYYQITASVGALQATRTGSFVTSGGTENCSNGIDDNHNGRCDYLGSICSDGSLPGDPACSCTPDFECTHGVCGQDQKWTMTCIDRSTPKCQPDYSYQQDCGCELTCGVCQHADTACTLCLADSAPCCGNGTCEVPTEDINNCPADCQATCVSDWECTAWLPEICPANGIQVRQCFDKRACPIPTNQPPTQQSCGPLCPGLSCGSCQQINTAQCLCEQLIPCCGNGICETGEDNGSCSADCIKICLPSWTCSAWSNCTNGVSRRQCTDLNNCNLDLDRPPEVRACTDQCNVACNSCEQLNLVNCVCAPTLPCCGNHSCEAAENNISCPVDCGLPPQVRLALSQCLDGTDNDKDGFIDYPADLSCKTPLGNSESSLLENIQNVTNFLQKNVISNPVVQKTNTQIVAPTLVAAVAVNTFATFSFFNFFSYLQFFTTQPIAALFRRRRKKWGVVYNSLTKQPVDLAIVRLYQKDNGRLTQSRVTDKQGRYNILAAPGKYYLTVTKPKYDFPTVYLKNEKEDVKYLDLYHGDVFEVNNNNVNITLNIPVDPKEEHKPVGKIVLQHYLRKLQSLAAFSAVPLALLSVAISPGILTGSILVVHCILYLLFRRLGYQKPPRNWGKIFDLATKKPINQAVVRIYDKKYNKLLETRITDFSGRYSFLVNDNVYFVTAEKAGYQIYKSQDIDLVGAAKEKIVGLDIGLKKSDQTGSALPSAEIPMPTPPAAAPVLPPVLPTPQPILEPQPKPIPEPKITEPTKPSQLGVGRESLVDLLKNKVENQKPIEVPPILPTPEIKTEPEAKIETQPLPQVPQAPDKKSETPTPEKSIFG